MSLTEIPENENNISTAIPPVLLMLPIFWRFCGVVFGCILGVLIHNVDCVCGFYIVNLGHRKCLII